MIINDLVFSYVSLPHIPGTFQLDATHSTMPCPIGTVWFRFCSDNQTIEILYSIVNHHFQRHGIRVALSVHLLNTYPSIKRFITGGGTDSSIPWMLRFGYKYRGTYYSVSRKLFMRKYQTWMAEKQQELLNN